jgi:hypothetical protein
MLKGMEKCGPLLMSREITTQPSFVLFNQTPQDLLLVLQLDYSLRNHACQYRSFEKYGNI